MAITPPIQGYWVRWFTKVRAFELHSPWWRISIGTPGMWLHEDLLAIDPAVLEASLREQGWESQDLSIPAAIWMAPGERGERIFVPHDRTFDDYLPRLREALDAIRTVDEERWPALADDDRPAAYAVEHFQAAIQAESNHAALAVVLAGYGLELGPVGDDGLINPQPIDGIVWDAVKPMRGVNPFEQGFARADWMAWEPGITCRCGAATCPFTEGDF